MPLLLGHFVVAVLLPAGVHLRAREPVSGFTWSAASVSGTDADAMSGAFPTAGFVAGLSFFNFLVFDFMTANLSALAISSKSGRLDRKC